MIGKVAGPAPFWLWKQGGGLDAIVQAWLVGLVGTDATVMEVHGTRRIGVAEERTVRLLESRVRGWSKADFESQVERMLLRRLRDEI